MPETWSSLALLAGLLEVVNDGRIGQRGGVAKVVFALCYTAEDAAHDLAAPRLGQLGGEDDLLGPSVRADDLANLLVELLDELVRALRVALQDYVGDYGLALVLVVAADNRGLGDGQVPDERALDLGGRDAVARDVHNVVHTARDPEVPVLVAPCAVAGEVDVAVLVPVGVPVALGILVEGAQHAWPRPLYDQVTLAFALNLVALLIVESREDTGEREGGTARLGPGDTGKRRDHDPTRLGLPPGVHYGAPSAADVLVVPLPCPGVDGLADGPEQPQGGEVVLLEGLGAALHERPDGGRRGVEDVDLVVLDDLPPAVAFRVGGRSLEDEGGRPVAQGPVDDVGVARDPPDVRRAPVDVIVLDVEDPLGRGLDVSEVAAGSVNDALGFAGRAGGVEDVEDVLGVGLLGRTLLVGVGHQVVPPVVSTLGKVNVVAATPDDDHALDAGRVLEGLVGVLLEGCLLSSSRSGVRGA